MNRDNLYYQYDIVEVMECDIWSWNTKDIEASILLFWITCSRANQHQYCEDT